MDSSVRKRGTVAPERAARMDRYLSVHPDNFRGWKGGIQVFQVLGSAGSLLVIGGHYGERVGPTGNHRAL